MISKQRIRELLVEGRRLNSQRYFEPADDASPDVEPKRAASH